MVALRALLFPCLLLGLPGISIASDSIYRCVGADGTPLFANRPCEEDSLPLTLPPLGVIGSDDNGRSLKQRLKRISAQPDPAPPARQQRDQPASGPLGFSERIQLRKLEMRRDSLTDDLSGSLPAEYRAELRRELKEVNRQLQQLQARSR